MESQEKVRSKKKVFIILGMFLLLLSTLRIGWVIYHKPPQQPVAENAVIDFSDWDFTIGDTVTLDGEWGFIPNEFVDGQTFVARDKTNNTDRITVPDDWESQFNLDESALPFGYGTYYLKVILPEDNEALLGLRIKKILTAADIYINDKLFTSYGHLKKANPEKSAGTYGPYADTFHTTESELTIIIHTANYESPVAGGITESIKIGMDTSILQEAQQSKKLQLIVSIIYLLHALYAFSLYFMAKRKYGKEIMYFGLMLLLHGISILIDDDIVVHLPLDYLVYQKVLFIFFVLTLLGNVLFIKHLFHIQTKGYKRLLIFFIITFILMLWGQPEFFTPIFILGYTLYLVAIVFMYYHVIKISQTDYPDAILILLFISSYTSNMLWGGLMNLRLINIPFYPIDFAITIITIALLLIRRYIYLSKQNDQQTLALKKMDKARDDFLARTSHELRNPLNGIVNIAQSILEQEANTLTQQNKINLQLLIQIGKKMGHTLNDLSTITRGQNSA